MATGNVPMSVDTSPPLRTKEDQEGSGDSDGGGRIVGQQHCEGCSPERLGPQEKTYPRWRGAPDRPDLREEGEDGAYEGQIDRQHPRPSAHLCDEFAHSSPADL